MCADPKVISIIDDDASVRAATDNLLRSLGYIVYTFVSAEEFLRSARFNASALSPTRHQQARERFAAGLQQRRSKRTCRFPHRHTRLIEASCVTSRGAVRDSRCDRRLTHCTRSGHKIV